jgi:hypothetical protein
MNRFDKTMIALALVCFWCMNAWGQFSSTGETVLPPSAQFSLRAPQTVTLPALDNFALLAEDEAEVQAAYAEELIPQARIARPLDVNYSLENSGTWESLPDGSQIWRLRIVSPNATDMWLVYDRWRIVKPCELFVYNDDRSMVFGPFTYIDNFDGTNVTPIVQGEAVTLEYHVPVDQHDIGELSILRVLHGYRHFHDLEARERDALDGFGDALDCELNVACFSNMLQEKRAVAMIIDPSGGTCTGTLLNNTLQNGDPLFQTAFHCINGNVANWLFYFNYESSTCSPSQNGNLANVVANASLLMSHQESDHALLRLSTPRPAAGFVPAFMGFNRGDTPATSSHCIHHPRADVKKALVSNGSAFNSTWNGQWPNSHWRTAVSSGISEPGSSGSPLIDQNGRVVGELHGGSAPVCGQSFSTVYGKLAYAWEGGGTTDTRLHDWLDPENSGATTTNFWQPQAPPNDSCGQAGFQTITSLPFSTTGSTLFATNNFSTFACATNNSPDMIYLMQLACDRDVTVSACGSEFDTELFVYQATSCSNWTVNVACNDDYCGEQSQVEFPAFANVFYAIVLKGYGSASGNFTLDVSGVPCSIQVIEPPNGLTVNMNIATASAELHWYPVENANTYWVYRSLDQDNIVDEANMIAEVSTTMYDCAGCLNQPGDLVFFAVRAGFVP